MQDIIIKKSKIHGRGVFANRDFKKGEIVLKWDISRTIPEKEFRMLSEQEKIYTSFTEKGRYFMMQSPAKYVNSSCQSNTTVKNFCDIAIKNIKKGDEITSNYFGSEYLKEKCNCGSEGCISKMSK